MILPGSNRLLPSLIFSLILFCFPSFGQEDPLDVELKKANSAQARADVLVRIVDLYQRSDSAKAARALIELQKIAENSGSRRIEIGYKRCKGQLLLAGDQFEEARAELAEALQMAVELNYLQELRQASYYLGETECAMGKYEIALQHLFQAANATDKLLDKGETASHSSIFKSINKLYQFTGHYNKALEYAHKSLVVDQRAGDSTAISKSLNNIGASWAYLGNADSSLKYCLLSIEMKRRTGSTPLSMVSSMLNISNLYIGKERYDSAFKYLYTALSTVTREKDDRTACKVYPSLAIAWFKLKDYDSAIYYYNLSQPASIRTGQFQNVATNYYELSRTYHMKGDHQKAYENMMKYALLKDSLVNADNLKHMNEMGAKYETVKKDKELLQKDTEISRKNAQRNYYIIGLLAAFLLAGFIFRNYRQQQKANSIIAAQKTEVEKQKELVEEKNREVSDSIHYAKRIQGALLAGEHLLKKHLADHFVLYKPKDIVSGDFYWGTHTGDAFMLCTADCTGHGVPGAFMSLLNISKLNEVINEKKIARPDLVLNNIRGEIIQALNPEGSTEMANDGMDCVLISFDLANRTLEYASAHNPFYLVRNGQLTTCKADKMPVGRSPREHEPFTLHRIELQEGDTLYTLTDGYADQFGGEKGKKFKYKQLEELLVSISTRPMTEQKKLLDEAIVRWKGNLEQVDDVLIIGIRV